MNPDEIKSEAPIKVLIVDDEKDICFLLSTILKQKTGGKLTYVNSLSEATLALEDIRPSLIFLDNHLPDGLGINYLGFIKNKLPNAKIVMITAHDTVTDKKVALSRGADAFIGKPFNREIIYRTVDELLGQVI